MKARIIKKDELLSQAVVVPLAIVELATKQEQGGLIFAPEDKPPEMSMFLNSKNHS